MKHLLARGAAALALIAAGAVAPAAAQTHTFSLGGAYIDLHSKAPPLSSNPPTLPTGFEAGVKVDDASTVIFGYIYRVNERWSLEAALGIPPEHKTYGTDFIEPFGQVSSMKQVAPTVFVNWHFEPIGNSGVEPFVGLGLNYTKFIDGRSTPSGNAASGGPTKIKLSSSWGLAAHAGLAYKLDQNWSILGTIAYADVESDVTATTTTGTGQVVRRTTIDFRPVVYTLCIGYSF
ncbi:OmpW/AlkL family protein [Caldimonas sp. KR1-144]|uniref:OmpW/AlkL family protein n=1 Tax=Caldimonas sp. KR1-144 TaxID=3400911 RepID=UPI003C0AE700